VLLSLCHAASQVAGVSVPAAHPALHCEDLSVPNSFSHYPMVEEVYEVHNVEHYNDELPSQLL
jgi:hypothetical protein